MGSGGRGEEDALVDWTYSALVVLRIACLLGVIYGFVKQHCDPLFQELNKQRLGGSFEFLTMIAALLTIFVMAFGLITSALSRLRTWHLHLVSVLLPIETLVTLCSWSVWIFYPQGLLSPEAIAMGYLEFDAEIHYCLHLVPWLGLLADMVGERGHYLYDRMQGVAIFLTGAGYALWLGFLYVYSGRWVYNMLGQLEMWQVFVGLVSTMTICLGTWQLGTSWEGSTVASPINSMIINIVAHVILSMQHRQKYMASCSL